jgi:alginate O-acetyltransferase complex protein AlgI
MLFNSTTYGVFLFAAYLGFWLLRTHRLARTLFLVMASYIFYFYGTYDSAIEQAQKGDPVPVGPIFWSFLCLGIIFVGSSLDFAIGRVLGRTETPWKRKALLLASIAYYLGVWRSSNTTTSPWTRSRSSHGCSARTFRLGSCIWCCPSASRSSPSRR